MIIINRHTLERARDRCTMSLKRDLTYSWGPTRSSSFKPNISPLIATCCFQIPPWLQSSRSRKAFHSYYGNTEWGNIICFRISLYLWLSCGATSAFWPWPTTWECRSSATGMLCEFNNKTMLELKFAHKTQLMTGQTPAKCRFTAHPDHRPTFLNWIRRSVTRYDLCR